MNTNIPATFKKNLPVVLVVGLLMVGNLIAIAWYVFPPGPKHWEGGVVPGKVFTVSSSTLTTIDPRSLTHEFILTPDTKFVAGKTFITSADISQNTMVLIMLDDATTTPSVAREVRVITDKRTPKVLPK